MTSSASVTCILVNWNGWKDTIACLDSLQQSIYKNVTVVVVDNGSTDDSVARIRDAHPNVLLIEGRDNLGFAGGNNIGIRYALEHKADLIWLLNNDTEIDSDALAQLVAKVDQDKQIGAVASICYYAEDPDKVQAWGGARINLWIGFGRNSTVSHPDSWFDALYGASMLIRSESIRDVGMLDEGFFHYWEETEFCLRLKKRGWKLAVAPDSRILHKVGSSTGRYNPVLDRYSTTSGLRILRLHSPAPHLAMTLFLTARFVRRILRLQLTKLKNVWLGLTDYLRSTPVIQKIR